MKRILCDHGVPTPLTLLLTGHVVVRTKDVGWDRLVNAELVSNAEDAAFDVLITTDRNMRGQLNLAGRRIAVVILGRQQWPDVKHHVQRILETVNASVPGSYAEVTIPDAGRPLR